MNTFTEENYLKAIFKLSESGNDTVSTNSIAAKLNTKAASVTDMLKKLSSKKLITYKKYKGVFLSPKGKLIAIEVIRKHRLWEMFLVEKLNFKWDEVHDVAEELEHIKSAKLIEHLDKFLGYPKSDPHGDPIPDGNGNFRAEKSKFLSELKQGEFSKVVGIADHSPEFLRFLDESKISIGDTITADEISEYDSSMKVKINNKSKLFLSGKVCENIRVKG